MIQFFNLIPFAASEKQWNLKTQISPLISVQLHKEDAFIWFDLLVIVLNESDQNLMQHYMKASFCTLNYLPVLYTADRPW
jgi:hypothetical protein